MAATEKWALATSISDKLVARNRIDIFNRKLIKLANRIAFGFDALTISVVASAVTQTSPALAAWSSTTTADPFSDITLGASVVDSLNQGYEIDTVLATPNRWARLISAAKVIERAPREDGGNSLLLTGRLAVIAGLNVWKTTNMPAGVDVMLLDSKQLGSIGWEDQGGGYLGNARASSRSGSGSRRTTAGRSRAVGSACRSFGARRRDQDHRYVSGETTMAKRMLRGKAPLTMYRGTADSAGGHIYRGSIIDPRLVDTADQERLVRELFLEWVVQDGESWRLAEDTDAGETGDPVTVGDVGLVDPADRDPGTTNAEADTSGADPAVEQKRAEARAKLAEGGGTPDGRSSNAVLVEYLVGKGYDRSELEKTDRSGLLDLLKR
jgi:hypothetical protein